MMLWNTSGLILLTGLISLCSLLPATALAERSQLPPGLPPSESILLPLDSATLGGAGEWGTMSPVPASGADPQFIRVQTVKQPALNYLFQLALDTNARVSQGDALLAVITARGAGMGAPEANLEFVFEENGGQWSKSEVVPLSVNHQWKTFLLPFPCDGNYAAGKSHVTLRLGYYPQTVEVADVRLLNFGKTADVKSLPRTRFSYEGREPDAPWRAPADARIDQLRKAPLNVVVVDSAGRPAANAQVSIRMKRHAFRFGTEATVGEMYAPTPDGQRCVAETKRLFNTVVPGVELKWPSWEDNPQRGTSFVDRLRQDGFDVRGHNLVWPGFQSPWYLPPRLKKGYDQRVKDPAAGPEAAKAWLREETLKHVREEAALLSDRITDWDVINEPLDNHDLMDILGPQIMADCYKTVAQASPNAKLVLNDYGIIEAGGDRQREDRLLQWISDIRQGGGRVDGIGMQSHFAYGLTAPDRILASFDRMAQKSGAQIQITEFDVAVADEQLQADYTRDFLTVTFSHPAVSGFTMWGFWDGENDPRLANPCLYRKDWTPKPNLKAYEDLVLKKWWTNADLTTAADGTASTRAFLGDYDITVQGPNGPVKATLTLKPGGSTVKVIVH